MLSLEAGYLAHLGQQTTTLARLWTITRTDGQVYRFTDHDRDLKIGGVTYRAAGYNTSAAEARTGVAPTSLEVSAVFDDASITVDDLSAGLWDGARVTIRECVWSDLSLGTRPIGGGGGVLGQVRHDGVRYTAEVLGLADRLATQFVRLLTPSCDAAFGDARCGANAADYTDSLTVTSVTDRAQFAASALTTATGLYDNGLVTWLTGANAGRSMEVKVHVNSGGAQVTLALPMVDDIAVGDTADIVAGCPKTVAACWQKFDNAVNFRGFPTLPGTDRVLAPVVSR